MIFQNRMKSACKAAETQLVNRSKVVATLNTQVEKLSVLARERMEAERATEDRIAQDLVNGIENTDEGSISRIGAEIKRHGRVANGLRAQIRAFVPGLSDVADKITAELPGHNQTVEEDFRREWTAAAGAFSTTLARRAVIEQALGKKLDDLISPTAGAIDSNAVGEMMRPHETLASVVSCLEAAASTQTMSTGGGTIGFDPERVYILDRYYADSDGLTIAAGTFVVAECFEPGVFRQLVEIGHAYPAPDPRIADATHMARMAISRIQQAERDYRSKSAAEGAQPISSQAPIDIPPGLSLQDVTKPDWPVRPQDHFGAQ